MLPFGPKYSEKILALPQVGSGQTIEKWLTADNLNLWEFNSILTQFITHEIESEMVRVRSGEAVAKVLHKFADRVR